MQHLHFTTQQLRRAYKRTNTRPVAGAWEATDIDGYVTHRCPLNLIFGAESTESAPKDTGSPRACIVGFILGWDGFQPKPAVCDQCYKLGAKLRAKLNPVWGA
jgi:hypothetical protein